jgi:hypothetical protein
MKKSNYSRRSGGLLLLALLCPRVCTPAHAGGEEFALCAKQYPDNNAERLRCYDNAQAAATISDLPQPEDDEEAPSAAAQAPVAERSYLTRLPTRMTDQSRRKQAGPPIPHRLNYLMVRKTFNVNNRPSPPLSTARPHLMTLMRWKPNSN